MKKRSIAPEIAALDAQEKRRRRLWRQFFAGIGLSILFVLLNIKFEQTPAGRDFDLMVYTWLQRRLIAPAELPVAVIDISELRPSAVEGSEDWLTRREPLIDLIEAVAGEHPKAIGIDIDFSATKDGAVDPVDPLFFQYCLRWRQRKEPVSVFLGVWRTQGSPAPHWLGDERYRPLAASLMIPNDSRQMLKSITHTAPLSEGPTLSAALAGAYGHHEPWLARFSWILEEVSEEELTKELKISGFLVDYSPLERIQKDRTIHLDKESFGDRKILKSVISSRKEILKDSMVLIGDAEPEKASDQVYVAVAGRHVPGVFVQACAAYTLATAPLYVLRHWWRPVVDVTLSLVVFAFVSGAALYYNRSGRTIATHRLQVFSVTLMVAFVVFVGLGLVALTRVMWDDFLLLAIALIIHSPVERFLTGTFRWLKTAAPSAWDRLIAGKEDE